MSKVALARGGRYVQAAVGELVRSAAWRMDQPPIKPRQVIVDLTDRCFFRCPTCDKWRARDTAGELSTEAWIRTLTALRAWMGPFHLSISGGEPLLRDDLPDLIAFASQAGCTTNLMTNGWLLDAALASALAHAGLGNLTLSLNGVRPETHDATRGIVGSHARVVAAVHHFNHARRALAREGHHSPTLSLNVIVAGFNAHELPDLVRWAEAVGIDAVGFQPLVDVANYQPYGRRFHTFTHDWFERSPLWRAESGAVDAALDALVDLKQAGWPILNSPGQLASMRRYFAASGARLGGRCSAGIDSFLIDPYGNVRLCYTMGVVGDVRRQEPAAVWQSHSAARVRRAVRACDRGCRLLNCNYRAPLHESLVEKLVSRAR